jgi:hypothetical protein
MVTTDRVCVVTTTTTVQQYKSKAVAQPYHTMHTPASPFLQFISHPSTPSSKTSTSLKFLEQQEHNHIAWNKHKQLGGTSCTPERVSFQVKRPRYKEQQAKQRKEYKASDPSTLQQGFHLGGFDGFFSQSCIEVLRKIILENK